MKKHVFGHLRDVKTKADYTKVFLDEKTPTDNLSVGFAMFPPGHETRRHTHDVEEAILVLSGYGEAFDGEGNKHELKPGTFIYIPTGGKHNVKNTSDMPLEFVFVITKAKFESIFEK